MRSLVLVIIVILRATTASAQTQPQATPSPDALAAAKELKAIITPEQVDETTRRMVTNMWPQLEHSFSPQIDAATRAELRSALERTMQEFVIDAMQDFTPIYARYFTADELRQLVAFYKTPIGAKALSLMPKIMGEFPAILQRRLPAFQQQLRGRLQEILQKHGIQ